jgi:hypothetical protein
MNNAKNLERKSSADRIACFLPLYYNPLVEPRLRIRLRRIRSLCLQIILVRLVLFTGTRILDPFFSFGPSRDYGMDLCLEVYL